jgi:hypothetical protein
MSKKDGALTRRLLEEWEREAADEGYSLKPTPEERREWRNPLCGHCGHFTSWDSDNYTNYGTAEMMEPPDPIYLCARCVAVEIAEAMERGRLWDAHWRPARWEYDVARVLGFKRAEHAWVKVA